MPHDADGNLLKAGDTVILTARVREVWPNESACNVSLDVLPTDRSTERGESYLPSLTCNTTLCRKATP